ncbi:METHYLTRANSFERASE PMT2-RELATED [Salix purpurea]|uniref:METHYLTRANSFERASE PMT2-RELATED n=1 Tax=Salix purpurea TaxID=77065 RepID=A0A9Q0U9V9_SALPP|nr:METHYLTRANSFERASE PMT2-RELATED [Salix purpurea]
MALKSNSADGRTRSSIQIFIVVGLCGFFYILGAWQRSGFGKADNLAMEITKSTGDCNIIPNLSFETHHGGDAGSTDNSDSKPKTFQPCHSRGCQFGRIPLEQECHRHVICSKRFT